MGSDKIKAIERAKNRRSLNKKGSVIDIILVVALAMVIILFFAFWNYGFGKITGQMQNIPSGKYNISGAVNDTFAKINQAQGTGLKMLSWLMIAMMFITIILSNFLVKAHPAWIIGYIFIVIVAVVLAVPISNAYEEIMGTTLGAEALSGFSASTYIMLYLPVWVTVIGLIGCLVLFAGILVDRGSGGGLD